MADKQTKKASEKLSSGKEELLDQIAKTHPVVAKLNDSARKRLAKQLVDAGLDNQKKQHVLEYLHSESLEALAGANPEAAERILNEFIDSALESPANVSSGAALYLALALLKSKSTGYKNLEKSLGVSKPQGRQRQIDQIDWHLLEQIDKVASEPGCGLRGACEQLYKEFGYASTDSMRRTTIKKVKDWSEWEFSETPEQMIKRLNKDKNKDKDKDKDKPTLKAIRRLLKARASARKHMNLE